MNYAEKAKDFIDEIVNDTLNVTPYGGSMFDVNKTKKEFHKLIDEMQAEIDRLGQDAERYARLKDDFSAVSPNIDGYHVWAYKRNYSLRGANLDEAIDAAMKEQGDKT